MKSLSTTTSEDPARRTRALIATWLSIDREAQDQALARLIAASVHGGVGSALERFAGTGRLDAEAAMDELDEVRVPLEREGWVDSLGRFIILRGGRP